MISYVLLMRNANTAERYWNETVGDPPPMQGDRVRGERGSGPGLVYVSQTERELAVDAVLSNGGGQFNGLEGRQGQSAHMDGNMPAGGNILFLDGHVTWRPWSEMDPQPRATGGPGFHW